MNNYPEKENKTKCQNKIEEKSYLDMLRRVFTIERDDFIGNRDYNIRTKGC
jgi:hypothetical protein